MVKFNADGMGEFNPTVAQVEAFQAFRDGNANRDQQKMAFDCLLRDLCMTLDVPFVAGGEDGNRSTHINMGRQMVGLLVRNMLEPGAIQRAERADEARKTEVKK